MIRRPLSAQPLSPALHFRRDESSFRITLGDHDLTSEDDANATGYAVLHVKMHEDYDPVTIDNDIALITLERQVEFTDEVYPVCLPKDAQNLFVGEDAKLAGRRAK